MMIVTQTGWASIRKIPIEYFELDDTALNSTRRRLERWLLDTNREPTKQSVVGGITPVRRETSGFGFQ